MKKSIIIFTFYNGKSCPQIRANFTRERLGGARKVHKPPTRVFLSMDIIDCIYTGHAETISFPCSDEFGIDRLFLREVICLNSFLLASLISQSSI